MEVRIAVIGRGNVGSHLFKAFSGASACGNGECITCSVVSVAPRTFDNLPADADVYIIAVPDAAISTVARGLAERGVVNAHAVVAHTSGTTPMSVLGAFTSHGVFYPLQTFSRDVALDYAEIPMFIEGNSDSVTSRLMLLARSFSSRVEYADSRRRRLLHLAAVYCCNFTQHLFDITDRLLHTEGLDISVMRPLIRETVGKLDRCTPSEGQTGPAVRGDMPTMNAHLALLASLPNAKPLWSNIYQLLSDSITDLKAQKDKR